MISRSVYTNVNNRSSPAHTAEEKSRRKISLEEKKGIKKERKKGEKKYEKKENGEKEKRARRKELKRLQDLNCTRNMFSH